MTRRFIILATAAALSLGSVTLVAQQGPPANPGDCPNCPTGGVPRKDGSGRGAKKGKQSGPRDGSGPMHKGQGRGQGQGRRGGRN
jgi:hypothetical protein